MVGSNTKNLSLLILIFSISAVLVFDQVSYADHGFRNHFDLNERHGDKANDPKVDDIFWDRANNDSIGALLCSNDKCGIQYYLDPQITNLAGPSKPTDRLTFNDVQRELDKARTTVNSISDSIFFVQTTDSKTTNKITASRDVYEDAPGEFKFLSYYQNDDKSPTTFHIRINTWLNTVPDSRPSILQEFAIDERCGSNLNVNRYFDIEKTFNHELLHSFAVPHSFDKESLAPKGGYWCGDEFG